MRKLPMLIALALVLAVTSFAEGDIHTGGRTCPPNQTCLHEPENPPAAPPNEESTDNAENSTTAENAGDETVYNQILLILESIF